MVTRVHPSRGVRRARRAVLCVFLLALTPVPLPVLAGSEPVPALEFATSDLELGVRGLVAPRRAPIAFTLLGVRLSAGGSAAVRTSLDGQRWSAWHELEQGAEGPSEPLWTGPARWFQVRGPAGASARVHLIDSLGLERGPMAIAVHVLVAAMRPSMRADAAHAAPDRPVIVGRAQWGADERLRKGSPRHADGVRALVLHHTAGGNTYAPEEAAAVVRAVYGYHTRVRGWDDIGYNLLVDRYGRVYEGRAGGLDRPVIGAHTGGFNERTSGVALLGSFDHEPPPAPAVRALVDVLAWKAGLHRVDPHGTAELRSSGSTRHAPGTRVRVATLSGHRDLASTACPGQALYDRLPALREAVARRMREPNSPLPDLSGLLRAP